MAGSRSPNRQRDASGGASGGRGEQQEAETAVDGEEPVAIVERDHRADIAPLQQSPPQPRAAVIGRESPRHDEPEASAVTPQQRQRSIDEQLIRVGVRVAQLVVDA